MSFISNHKKYLQIIYLFIKYCNNKYTNIQILYIQILIYKYYTILQVHFPVTHFKSCLFHQILYFKQLYSICPNNVHYKNFLLTSLSLNSTSRFNLIPSPPTFSVLYVFPSHPKTSNRPFSVS